MNRFLIAFGTALLFAACGQPDPESSRVRGQVGGRAVNFGVGTAVGGPAINAGVGTVAGGPAIDFGVGTAAGPRAGGGNGGGNGGGRQATCEGVCPFLEGCGVSNCVANCRAANVPQSVLDCVAAAPTCEAAGACF